MAERRARRVPSAELASRLRSQAAPIALYGRWLESWCHLRQAERDFTVANIETVAPVR